MREWEQTGIIKQEPATSQTRQLTVDNLQHIEEVVTAFRASLEVTVDKTMPRDAAKEFSDLINIAEIGVRRVIDMAKKVKTFKALPQADQISLLKGGSIELLILRSVINYDKDKNHFLDKTDNEVLAMTTEQFKTASGNLFDDHMKFVRSLSMELQADETTLILLLAISLFSPDRPNLFNKNLVWQEQERYSMLLQKYLESRYPLAQARYMYPKLLMKLVDLRDLNEQHSQVLLKVNPEVIQPLMQEVLDLRA